MDTPKEFQILVRRKIPYLTESIWGIVMCLALILLLLYFFMMPAKYASDEMATAYYMLVVPEWLKKISSIALAGLIFFTPIYYAARLKKPALLTIGDNILFIKGKQIDLAIFFKNIKKIYFNDLKNWRREFKGKMQIVIQQRSGRATTFLLLNYEDAELALETLSKLTDAEFLLYEDNMLTHHDEDE